MKNKKFNDIKRIIILGETGFLGSRLGQHFRQQFPDKEIIGYSSFTIDLTKPEEVSKLCDVFDLTSAVVMCSMIKKQAGDNLETFSRNLAMTVNVSRVLEKNPVRRFVYLSSAAVYGEDVENICITEETGVQATSYYGLAKYASECLLRKMIAGQPQSSLLILRPPTIYGPGDRGSSYGPTGFIKKAIAQEPIVLWGDGMEQREFIFIDDFLVAASRLLFHEFEGVVNVVSGKSYTFQDVLTIIPGFGLHILEINSRERTKNKVDHGFSNAKLKKLLPDMHFTPLQEGVEKTFYAESNQEVVARG